jgi:hypothetical protein
LRYADYVDLGGSKIQPFIQPFAGRGTLLIGNSGQSSTLFIGRFVRAMVTP